MTVGACVLLLGLQLGSARLEGDERALGIDPFAEAPLRDLVSQSASAGGVPALLKRFLARAGDDTSAAIVVARLELSLGKRDQALSYLRRALRTGALQPRAAEKLGELFDSVHADEDAIVAFERALTGLPEGGLEWRALALRQAGLLLAHGKDKAADALLARLRQGAPSDLELRRRIADLFVARGATAKAVAELNGALPLATAAGQKVALHRRVGELYERTNFRAAAAAYLEAWRLADAGGGVRSDLCAKLVALYKAHGALAELCGRLAPAGAWDALLASDACVMMGDKKKAEERLRAALEREPSSIAARERLVLLLPSGSADRVALETELARRDPDNPVRRLSLARSLFLAQREKEALAVLAEIATHFADAPYVLVETAELLAERKHAREALSVYARLLALDPRNPAHHKACADLYEQLGDRPRAVASLVAMLGSAPDEAAYQQLLGLLSTRGYVDETRRYYREALARFPGADQLRREFAVWLLGRNDLDGAIAEWKELAGHAAQPSLRELARYQLERLERRRLFNR